MLATGQFDNNVHVHADAHVGVLMHVVPLLHVGG